MEISKEFILEAHKAACRGWKDKIEKEFPTLFSNESDEIMCLPSYSVFQRHCTNNSIIFGFNRIRIQLPRANKLWSLAAFELAINICKGFEYFPVHAHNIKDSDTFADGDRTRVIVLERY